MKTWFIAMVLLFLGLFVAVGHNFILHEERVKITKELGEVRLQKAQADSRVVDTGRMLQEARQEIGEADMKIKDNLSQISLYEKTIDAQVVLITGFKKRIGELERHVARLIKKVDLLEGQLHAVQGERDALIKRVRELETSLETSHKSSVSEMIRRRLDVLGPRPPSQQGALDESKCHGSGRAPGCTEKNP
jgi:chromosome segregation ATPase